jgi:hypothetical protein
MENNILSEVNQVQKPKAACFLSYVEYRPNTNIHNSMNFEKEKKIHFAVPQL